MKYRIYIVLAEELGEGEDMQTKLCDMVQASPQFDYHPAAEAWLQYLQTIAETVEKMVDASAGD